MSQTSPVSVQIFSRCSACKENIFSFASRPGDSSEIEKSAEWLTADIYGCAAWHLYTNIASLCTWMLINTLSGLAVDSLVVTRSPLPAAFSSLPPTPHHAASAKSQYVHFYKSKELHFSPEPLVYSALFPPHPLHTHLTAVNPGPWRQIVVCSFACLMPHHMAPEN